MMASLASRTFDLASPILLALRPSSELRTAQRRMSRIKTLDQDVVVVDGGFVDGDRTIRLRIYAPSVQDVKALQSVSGSRLSVSTDEGCFEAIIESYSLGDSPTVTLAIIKRLSED
jgi:hypothetical protein